LRFYDENENKTHFSGRLDLDRSAACWSVPVHTERTMTCNESDRYALSKSAFFTPPPLVVHLLQTVRCDVCKQRITQVLIRNFSEYSLFRF
jgi:hypothetical protein